MNPAELAGTRTGVWIGASGSETIEALTSDAQNMERYVITGCSLSMFANRISFFFDFKGKLSVEYIDVHVFSLFESEETLFRGKHGNIGLCLSTTNFSR